MKTYRTAFAEYRQRRQIGAGACGSVFEVANEDGDMFALKILYPGIESKKLRRFKNEIAFCQRCSHNNIIRILDHGVSEAGGETRPFYVMPFFPSTLRDLISNGVSRGDALQLFDQILSGAEAAHLLGVVHRDLKPENILVDPTNHRLVLADFGIASFQEEDLFTAVETRDGDRLANFKYAAPEQKERGRDITAQADIFALGLMLNEMFTGAVPGGSNFRKIAEVSEEHGYLDGIVEGMIDQDPARRPQSVGQVKLDIAARGNEFISFQKLNRLKSEVVPESESDDPLVRDPIRIVSRDYARGRLVLRLSQPPSSDWISIFQGGGWNHSSIDAFGPRAFEFQADAMSLPGPSEQQVQIVIDHAKDYVRTVNSIYKGQVERGLQERREQLRRRRAQEIEEEERRRRILHNSHI